MQVLHRPRKNSTIDHLVFIFGLGLIGTAIRDRLLQLGYAVKGDVVFDWHDRSARIDALDILDCEIQPQTGSETKCSVIWSAGKANFHSTHDEVRRQGEALDDIVRFALNLEMHSEVDSVDFHFISSAGGLFEGQCLVSKDSEPAPLRPYGESKLNQEIMLKSCFNGDKLSIYRPSSVYGPMRQKSRQGLINNLIHNGMNGNVTILDAHVMSLRDYVYSGDIGGFVAKKILSGGFGVHYLVSSRCSSIFEVVSKIERTLKIRLRVRYDEFFGNHTNITFSHRILSPNWTPTPLEVGIRQFLVTKKDVRV